MALRKQAIELLAGGMASQEEVDALADALETAMKNANKPSGGGSSSGGHKGSSSGSGGDTSYAGEGIASAVVGSSATVGTAAKSVISDTTAPFILKRGSAYCFKMTVVNGSAATLHGWKR